MDLESFLKNTHNIILNEQQREGVLSIDKSTLLLAVPGSGKTTVLVSRIANLIVNFDVDENSILTITYSRETARDMKHRFISLFSALGNFSPAFRTIHSFCLMVLKFYAKVLNRQLPTLITSHKTANLKQQVLRELYQKNNAEFLTDDVYENLERQICFVKNMLFNGEQIESIDKDIPKFSLIFKQYEQYKKQNGLIDYDDMLTLTYDIFRKFPRILAAFQNRYQYINIDEAQDTSLLQHRIIQLLSEKSLVFMVGDEDQSIYSFRGAYPQALLEFEKIYPNSQIIKLEQNFRSNHEIVKKANDFIKINKQRYDKNMFTTLSKTDADRTAISLHTLSDYSEQYDNIADIIENYPKDKTLAILYRNNESVIPVIDLLYKRGISFYIKEHNITYFTSFVIRDIVSFMMLCIYPCDIDSFKQIYYKLGLNRAVFDWVIKNYKSYDDVFSCVLDLYSITEFRKEKFRYYKSTLKRMIIQKPVKAIETILDDFDYQYYIDNRLSDGFLRVNAYQKINTAICLAKGTDSLHEFLEKLELMEKSMKNKQNVDSKSNIVFSTLHSCKGMEFDTVILVDMIKDVLPSDGAVKSQLLGDIDSIEEEVRLFYVGVTRAKQKIIMYKSHRLNGIVAMPSRFIEQFINGRTKANIPDKPRVKKNFDIPSIVGRNVSHAIFGKGIVEDQNNDIITVSFVKSGSKNMSYSFCIDSNLLDVLDDEADKK